ncbi:MAG: uroporphyrinogen decarboxylase family protein [Ardenticatenaceae bacterium]|nr:uroporphyrinogen decarboxylase family protein [Ardenticatenaceae bacterium]
MNSKERVKLAFNHQEADRVPIFELTIDNPTAKQVLGRDNLCGFGGTVRGLKHNEALINGRIDAYHQQRVADEIALWKALDLDVYPNAYPVPAKPLIPQKIKPHTWLFTDPVTGQWSITKYSPESDTYDQVNSTLRQDGLNALRTQTEALEAVTPSLADWDFTPVETFVRELGKDRFVMGVADVEIGSTWDWAEHFLMGLILEPDLIHRYLDARLRITLLILEEMLKLGVDGVHGGYDWASARGPMFSPKHFDLFVFPRLKQITDLCHQYGVPYVKHTDGNVNKLLDGMIKAGVDGFQAIEPGANMDIAHIKQVYGDRLTLIGNVDCATVLVDGPIEAVRAQTREVIQAAAPGGGYLLSTSNSVHPGVKPEFYLAMLETAREAGKYPIQL